MRDSDAAQRIYKRLLVLYPKDFRERVGRSMEQTFADNLRERRDRGDRAFAFFVWTFAETSLGIMKERFRRQRRSSVVAAVVALLFVLPFMLLEWATSSDLPRTNFAFPLFVVMWFMAALFTRTFIGVMRTGRPILNGHHSALSHRSISLAWRIVLMGWIGWIQVFNVLDQWPCFLGASGC